MSFKAYPINEQIHISNMYSFFSPAYPDGYTFSGEVHDFWECLYVIRGSVCISAEERIYNLTDGEIIFHKPNELHKFYIENPQGAKLIIFSFSAEGELCEFLKNKVFKLSSQQKDILFSMFTYARTTMEKIFPNDSRIGFDSYLLPVEKLPGYGQMLAAHICQLVLSLSDEGSIADVSTSPDSILFGRAVSYMNSVVTQNPSVYEIARFCNISEAGLKRIFEKYAGIGVHKYFLKLKFAAAGEQLLAGTPVGVVAENLGFSSQAYFTKSFRREMGHLPSQHRANRN